MCDTYYEELIKKWKTGGEGGKEGGWAGLYYGVVSKVINDNNFKICAEVGIGYGFHAKQILDDTNIEKLYLIDPMKFYEYDGWAKDVQYRYKGFDNLIQNIKTHLSIHKDRYTWYIQPSVETTNEQVPDESIDLAFIDGDHSFKAVSIDLPLWWGKLKKGGWMLGDDYNRGAVKNAVDTWANNMGLTIQFLYKEGSTHAIYYFIK